MAKVVAPLQSFSASGKVGKSLVFFSHLGRNVVRGLVTPANPQTTGQGDARLLLGALGRALRAVVTGSAYEVDGKSVSPTGQTYGSYFVTQMIQYFGSGNTGVDAMQAAVTGHTAASDFESAAVALGIGQVEITYAETGSTTISPGAMLYALAQHAFNIKATNPSKYSRTPYTTALASWTDTEIAAFVSDLQS